MLAAKSEWFRTVTAADRTVPMCTPPNSMSFGSTWMSAICASALNPNLIDLPQRISAVMSDLTTVRGD